MDSYFHATFVPSSPYTPPLRPTLSTSQTLRVPPFPPSNPDFKGDEFNSPEGVWKLRNEVYSETLLPHYQTGTHATLVSIKYKESNVSALGPAANLTLTNSATSSVSDNLTSLTNSDKGDNATSVTAESEEDESMVETTLTASPAVTLSPAAANTEDNKSSLTIPIKNTSGSAQSLGYASSPLSSSASTASTIYVPPNGPQRALSINTASLYNSHQQSLSSPVVPVGPISSSYTNAHSGTEFMSPKPYLSFDSDTAASPLGSSGNSFSSLFGRSNKHNPRKPKNSITKTKSSFVSKIITNDHLAKVLAARTSDDAYLFYNVGTSFVWMDSASKPKEPLSRIIFSKAFPTSHDVNLLTRGYDHLDVIIGFSSGDCIWFDPLGNKYFRLNKGGLLNSSAVTMIKWIPGSENMFMVAYSDGSILIMDKERDDQAFTPAPADGWANQLFHITRPHKGFKHNPVSHWKVSQKGINAFAFSPDCLHVAVVGSDGLLRIIDYTTERLMDTYGTYYGKLTCVAWSPDGRYIVTGGQDDLVTIWALREQRIVARCQGHNSWVTGVAFDPWKCDEKVYRIGSVGEDCNLILWDFSVSALHKPRYKHNRTSTSLSNPKESANNWRSPRIPSGLDAGVKSMIANGTNPLGLRADTTLVEPAEEKISSFSSFSKIKRKSSVKHPLFVSPESNKGTTTDSAHHIRLPIIHPAPNKNQVPFLQPIVVRSVHSDPCVDIIYREDAIVTTDRRGRVRTWTRPT
ncbi:WD40-repeat-containing domain protein [Umbelopsis sp. PMI_123]|nr:WD40-repeat-containing domain protein [Umbelopsis sp. PMI_123]